MEKYHEWDDWIEKAFLSIDEDGSGELSREEVTNFLCQVVLFSTPSSTSETKLQPVLGPSCWQSCWPACALQAFRLSG